MSYARLISLMAAAAVYIASQAHAEPLVDIAIRDEKTALTVAEAILVGIYGAEKINDEKPLSISLDGDVWKIHGSRQAVAKDSAILGGVAWIHISRKNGCILELGHGM